MGRLARYRRARKAEELPRASAVFASMQTYRDLDQNGRRTVLGPLRFGRGLGAAEFDARLRTMREE